MYKFVIQAHFRGKHLSSVHLDYRFQHPKYKNFFFGFTQFIDKGNLLGIDRGTLEKLPTNSNDKERIQYAKNASEQWPKYFKDPSKKRLGLRKSMGSIKWFDVNGFIVDDPIVNGPIPKRLSNSDTVYSQVMLKIASGTYEIFEDRIYSIKLSFDKVETFYNVPDFWSNSTYIFRYMPFKDMSTPFSILSWKLKEPDYSDSKLNYVNTVNSKFNIYESSTELNGHYLLKDTGNNKWYTADRHPLYEEVFTIVKGRYQIRDHLDKIESGVSMSFDLFKAPKEHYCIGLTL